MEDFMLAVALDREILAVTVETEGLVLGTEGLPDPEDPLVVGLYALSYIDALGGMR